MLDRQVTLTSPTLLSLIRLTGAEPHTVLAEGHTWKSDEALGEQDRQAQAELARVGLHSRAGTDRGLLTTIEAIAQPRLEYYAWVSGGYNGEALRYTLLAGVGGNGVAFVLGRNTDAEAVVLATVSPNELLGMFVTQLPELPSDAGGQVSAPRSEVTGQGGAADDDGEFQLLRDQPPRTAGQADEIKRILGLPRIGGGSLYVAARNRAGTRQRARMPVNYIDTTEGRWLTEQAPGPGEPLVICTPATLRGFTSRLREAQNSLRDGMPVHPGSRIPR